MISAQPTHVNERIARRLIRLLPTGWKPLNDIEAEQLRQRMNEVVNEEYKSIEEEDLYE